MPAIRSLAAAPLLAALPLLHLCTAPPIFAAPPVATLVADIGSHVTFDYQSYLLAPRDGSVVRNGRLYFYFDDGIHGLELWASDGSASGTRMIRDVCPGACGAVWYFSYLALAATPNAVFFAANDGVHGLELWRTDGTEAGTRLVRDIVPGFGASVPRTFSALGDRLVFWADDGIHGGELWSSDGTTAGTQLVVDSSPGATGSDRGAACRLGNALIFAYGLGLWRTDGTASGTFEVSPVNGSYQNYLANSTFVCLADRVIFSGNGDHGAAPEGLWVSDGTASGTQQLAVADFWIGATDGNEAYFLAHDDLGYEIWRSDGSASGTSATPLPEGLWPQSMPGAFAAIDGSLYFIGRDESHGSEVWKFAGGTFDLLIDLNPGAADGFPLEWGYFETGRSSFLTALGSHLVFLASDGVHGLEPWTSQGIPGDAVRLADLAPGSASAHPDFLRSALPQLTLGDDLMLRWQDENLAVHLWKTDGTAAGSAPVVDLRTNTSAWQVPAPPAAIYSLPISCFAPNANGVTFLADDGPSGTEPWFSDGTSAGTHRIADFSPGAQRSSSVACAPIGGQTAVLLDGGDPYRTSLFAASGAEGSLQELAQLPDASGGVGDPEMFQGRVVFAAGGLPATDGTPGGTELLEPDFSGSFGAVEPVADLLFSSRENLFVSDGTPGNSVELLPLPPPDESLLAVRLAALDDSLLFFLWNAATGQELWRSDGSAEGTALVKDILPGPASGVHDGYFGFDPMFLTTLVPLGSIALFAADDGVHGEELWRTDGTAAGTVMVRDLFPGAYPSSPRELTRVGDHVFFTAESADAGRELWVSNGFSGLTRRVADLVPGAGSSVPQELAAIRDELWFSAWTPAFGREPWRLRRGAGRFVVAERLGDLAPGPLSSSPLIFRNAGADVFTVANDNIHGFELWKIRDPDLLFADDFESSGLALWAPAAP